jgi:hypothetical protein
MAVLRAVPCSVPCSVLCCAPCRAVLRAVLCSVLCCAPCCWPQISMARFRALGRGCGAAAKRGGRSALAPRPPPTAAAPAAPPLTPPQHALRSLSSHQRPAAAHVALVPEWGTRGSWRRPLRALPNTQHGLRERRRTHDGDGVVHEHAAPAPHREAKPIAQPLGTASPAARHGRPAAACDRTSGGTGGYVCRTPRRSSTRAPGS